MILGFFFYHIAQRFQRLLGIVKVCAHHIGYSRAVTAGADHQVNGLTLIHLRAGHHALTDHTALCHFVTGALCNGTHLEACCDDGCLCICLGHLHHIGHGSGLGLRSLADCHRNLLSFHHITAGSRIGRNDITDLHTVIISKLHICRQPQILQCLLCRALFFTFQSRKTDHFLAAAYGHIDGSPGLHHLSLSYRLGHNLPFFIIICLLIGCLYKQPQGSQCLLHIAVLLPYQLGHLYLPGILCCLLLIFIGFAAKFKQAKGLSDEHQNDAGNDHRHDDTAHKHEFLQLRVQLALLVILLVLIPAFLLPAAAVVVRIVIVILVVAVIVIVAFVILFIIVVFCVAIVVIIPFLVGRIIIIGVAPLSAAVSIIGITAILVVPAVSGIAILTGVLVVIAAFAVALIGIPLLITIGISILGITVLVCTVGVRISGIVSISIGLDLIHISLGEQHGLACLIRGNDFYKGSIRCHQRLLQILQKLCHVGIPTFLALLGTFENDLLQAHRDLRRVYMGRHHLFLQVLHRHGHCRFPVKGHPAGDHLIHNDTEGINIALGIAVAAAGLLRGRVVHGTHGHRADGAAGCHLGNAKIRHFHLSFSGNDDVLGLDVPVHNVQIVGRLNAHGHLNGNAGRLPDGQLALALDIIFEGNALHQFHNDIVDAVLIADIVHIYHVGMGQTGCRLGLCPEFCYEALVPAEFLLQHLDGHIPVQLVVFSFIYIGHSPYANMGNHLISISNKHSFSQQHAFTSSSNGSTRITEILSFPPYVLARLISSPARLDSSSGRLTISKISSSSSILVKPSEHSRILSFSRSLCPKKSIFTSYSAPMALVMTFLSGWNLASSLGISPIRTISSTRE